MRCPICGTADSLVELGEFSYGCLRCSKRFTLEDFDAEEYKRETGVFPRKRKGSVTVELRKLLR